MKTIIAIAIVLLTAPVAHADQFVGQGLGGTQSSGLVITSTATTINFTTANSVWSYDIDTDGITLDVNEVTVEWSATGLVLNPFESFDITLTAFVSPQTVSITPTATTVWKLGNAPMSSLSVSGTFYGFGGTVVPIAGSLSPLFPQAFADYIQLDQFPASVGMYARSTAGGNDVIHWRGSVDIGPSFDLVSGLLSTPTDPILDFIPEPTTSALALAALCLAMGRRRAF